MLRAATIEPKEGRAMDYPKTFEEAADFTKSAKLPEMLRQRLIQIAFDMKNVTTAFRAIELLMTMPQEEVIDDLESLTIEQLKAMEKEINEVYGKYLDDTEF